jgi:hypothetical protein
MMPGLWHEVIIKKYLQKKSVETWFRMENKTWARSSNFWRALISSLPVISDWLAWHHGNGMTIRLGVDPMVGCYNFYKLSSNLILALKEQVFLFLAQVGDVTGHTSWKQAEMLGLESELKHEWTNFTKGLSGA